MSVRRETVYWHGCADEGCDSDSHGCTRVEIWWESLGRQDTIAYIYEESIHCIECTERRFGRDDAGNVTGAGGQGHPAGELAPWDEWWDATSPTCQFLMCGTCETLIDESHDDGTCQCTARDGVAQLRKLA